MLYKIVHIQVKYIINRYYIQNIASINTIIFTYFTNRWEAN